MLLFSLILAKTPPLPARRRKYRWGAEFEEHTFEKEFIRGIVVIVSPFFEFVFYFVFLYKHIVNTLQKRLHE